MRRLNRLLRLFATLAAPLASPGTAPLASPGTALLVSLGTAPLVAQQPDSASLPADAFLDPGARTLLERARGFRDAADSSIISYTATVRSRVAAGLRAALKDRTLYREEAISRVRWSRDDRTIVLPLGYREQTPEGVQSPTSASGIGVDDLFDPTQDRIYFSIGRREDDDRDDDDDEIWIEHPLTAGSERHYRYQSGDTLIIRLQGGRVFRAIELRTLPRERSPHTVTGSLWIDPSTGAVAQAVYRLTRPMDLERDTRVFDEDDDIDRVPGIFRPFEFDISLVVVEYSLWNFEHWMPRTMRLEGYIRAGFIRAPGALELSYEIEDVVTESDVAMSREPAVVDSVLRAWTPETEYRLVERKQGGRQVALLLPSDSLGLLHSAELPPPIWKETPEFITEGELKELYERLSRLPVTEKPDRVAPQLVWGMGGADLLRYNRVEGLSVGARASASLPYAGASLTGRLGFGDWHPNLEAKLERATARRTVRMEAYHALTPMDPQAGSLGVGSSLATFLFGRDDGEYYRASGARVSLLPPASRRPWYDFTVYAQRERGISTETDVALPRLWNSSFRFRDALRADPADLAGITLALRPWWGTDPFAAQLGLELFAEAVTGDYEFARASATLRAALPVTTKFRTGFELGAGTTRGASPVQRSWLLGGPTTLRGYPGTSALGRSFARARVEAARTFGWGSLTVFSDAGWAGERRDFGTDDALVSAGVGLSLLDGLMRFDLARALRPPTGWRLELYLDSLL